jgi:hypothetical protein
MSRNKVIEFYKEVDDLLIKRHNRSGNLFNIKAP